MTDDGWIVYVDDEREEKKGERWPKVSVYLLLRGTM